MVIAIMSGTFERVDGEKEAYIYRTKLMLFISTKHRFHTYTKNRLENIKYMLCLDVDPEIDPIEKEGPDARINQNFSAL